jgi:hypothetical protein
MKTELDNWLIGFLGEPKKKYTIVVYKDGIHAPENKLTMMVSDAVYKQMMNLSYGKVGE